MADYTLYYTGHAVTNGSVDDEVWQTTHYTGHALTNGSVDNEVWQTTHCTTPDML